MALSLPWQHSHVWSAVARRMHGAGVAVLDALLPPGCMACGQPIAGGVAMARMGALCASCFSHWHLIGAPMCVCCGVPFAYEGEGGRAQLCPGCRALPPPFGTARGAVVYDDHSRPLILAMKHGGRTELARLFAPLMARAGAALLAEAPLLVPVPLHRQRLRERGFNQAVLLAAELSRTSGAPHLPDALQRLRATAKLAHSGAAARQALLSGAITVRPRRAALIEGRHVVVVDDVMTSGATVRACAEALLAAGATRVDALVAARVPDPELAGSAPLPRAKASAAVPPSRRTRLRRTRPDGDDA